MKNEARFLDSRQSLFCVVSAPSEDSGARDMGVVILNSGTIHNVGPFGLSVELAEGLTSAGFPVLRLDQTGKGESFTARRESSEMKTLARDLELAVAALKERFGVSKVAVLGLCSGADHGLMITDSIPEAGALIMLDGWAPKDLRYYLARYVPKLKSPAGVVRALLRRVRSLTKSPADDEQDAAVLRDIVDMPGRQWDQDAMRAHMRDLCAREIPLLAVYTGDTDDYYAYEGQLLHYLSRERLNSKSVTEFFKTDCKHLYPLIFQRRILIRDITHWLIGVVEQTEGKNNERRAGP
jgi:pimeloyl-ACP methyl ester carboxylesterase